jgi:hypothetical protein
MEKKFDVVIRDNKTREIVSTIGKNLTESQAEKREMTGLMRIDTDNYFVDTIKAK